MGWKEVEVILEEIRRRTKKQAYALVIDRDREPGLFDSKFGGLPYWDMEKEYPVDSNGNKMMLLAQINLERLFQEMERDELLPSTGMFQFFIALDDVYGMDFDGQGIQKNFKAVYHPSVNYQLEKAQVQSLDVPVCTDSGMDDCSPIWEEYAVKITRKTAYTGECDYRFEKMFCEVMEEKFGKQPEGKPLDEFLGEETYDKIMKELPNTGHWLLGYPCFTQTDPREYEEAYRYYDTQLFQMDSDYVEDEDYILWGDGGVANFLINQEDLKKGDFSNILYYWDCG